MASFKTSLDLTNQRFGKLVALKKEVKDKWNQWKWLCLCDCGNEVTIRGTDLKSGHTQSCGCRRKDIIKEIKLKKSKHLEYLYFNDINHPLSSDGVVYYHRYIASLKIGRWLTNDELVHHVDGDRTNNHPDNLKIIDRASHNRLHMLKGETPTTKLSVAEEKVCKNCGKSFLTKYIKVKFCSNLCGNNYRKKFEVSKEELEKLVWEKPTVEVAEQFGVSDKAIEKKCKKLGVTKPPRGYWNKVHAGKI